MDKNNYLCNVAGAMYSRATTKKMKFKQKIALGLCAFYLITVIGLAINMHFCAGKLSSVMLTEIPKCPACKDEKKSAKTHDCCKDKSVQVKIKDNHQAGFKVSLPKDYSVQLFLQHEFASLLLPVQSKFLFKTFNKAPPLSSIISLHVFNCVFRN
ncbi:MAG: hypothetical protein V4687_13005 [Bacteroidota bacterium]